MRLVKKMWLAVRHIVIGVLVSGVTAVPIAFSMDFSNEAFRPYVGIGGQILRLDTNKGYGHPLFHQSNLGGMVFTGLKLGSYMGVELGYNYFARDRDNILRGNDIFPGTGVTVSNYFGVDTFYRYQTDILIRDIHLAVTGYLPLKKFSCLFSRTVLFGSVGLGKTSIKARLDAIENHLGPIEPGLLVYSLRQKKIIPFIRMGIQQNMTDNINVSIFSEWKRLSAFKIKALPDESIDFQIRFKNSISYGLRLGYIF